MNRKIFYMLGNNLRLVTTLVAVKITCLVCEE